MWSLQEILPDSPDSDAPAQNSSPPQRIHWCNGRVIGRISVKDDEMSGPRLAQVATQNTNNMCGGIWNYSRGNLSPQFLPLSDLIAPDAGPPGDCSRK